LKLDFFEKFSNSSLAHVTNRNLDVMFVSFDRGTLEPDALKFLQQEAIIGQLELSCTDTKVERSHIESLVCQ
jgi:hypothetical protein